MKKTLISIIFLVSCGITHAQNASVETTPVSKKKKLELIKNVLKNDIKSNKSFTNKLGSFMKNHPILLTAPVGPIAVPLFILLIIHLEEKFNFSFPCPNFLKDDEGANLIGIIIAAVVAATLTHPLAYQFIKKLGTWLAGEQQLSSDALTTLLSVNEKNIPEEFVPLFEKFKKHK